jgi:hypothetical protein
MSAPSPKLSCCKCEVGKLSGSDWRSAMSEWRWVTGEKAISANLGVPIVLLMGIALLSPQFLQEQVDGDAEGDGDIE